jgi:hypothetical protein
MPEIGPMAAVPLGDVIAERRFTLWDIAGNKRQVHVRIGKPIRADESGRPVPKSENSDPYRCPLEITGLDCDGRIFAPIGEDAFVALQYAIYLAGGLIDGAVERLGLVNPLAMARERSKPGGPHFDESVGQSSWIWKYDHRPDMD